MIAIKCPCCDRIVTEDEINNGGVWGVEYFDLEHYKLCGGIRHMVYDVCDECFCDFGNEILPYDDQDVFESLEYSWLKDEKVWNFFKNEAECSYFMTKIPRKVKEKKKKKKHKKIKNNA